MRKTTSSILIGLACTSLLSLSTGVESVKADVQGVVKQTQVVKRDTLQDVTAFKANEWGSGYLVSFKANNLKNGQITDKTSEIAISQSNKPDYDYCLRDSSGNKVYNFGTNNLNGQTYHISLKAGETYYLSYGDWPNIRFFEFTVTSSVGSPTINKVSSQDKNITGKGLPGATLHLTIAGETYATVVDTSGNYNIPLNKTYAVNSAISLYQEMDGMKSDSVTSTVVAPEKLTLPTLNKVTTIDKKITGTGTIGATVHLSISDDDYTATVDTSGNYSISLNKTYTANSDITLYQEMDGIKSDSVTAKVTAPDKLDIPKINKVTDKDTTVTGTAAPGATIRLSINGSNFHTIASATGEFSINIGKAYPASTLFEIYQELDGVKSETTKVYVQLTANFIVDKIKSDATTITGSGQPNAKITVQIQDQDFTGTIDANGKFAVNLQGAKYKAGTNVTVTSIGSEETETKIVQIYPQDPVIGVVYASDKDVRGVTDPGATVIITIGAEKYQTTADSEGNFKQSVDPNVVVSGALVTVYSNVDGYKSDKVTKTVI